MLEDISVSLSLLMLPELGSTMALALDLLLYKETFSYSSIHSMFDMPFDALARTNDPINFHSRSGFGLLNKGKQPS